MYLDNRLLDSLPLFIPAISGYLDSRMMDFGLFLKDYTIVIMKKISGEREFVEKGI